MRLRAPSPSAMTVPGWTGSSSCRFHFRCRCASRPTVARRRWPSSTIYCPTMALCIAARTRAEGIYAYSLLGAIGHDCVGALQFLPQDAEPGPAGVIEGDRVNEDPIAVIIGDLSNTPLGMAEDESFRISLAGAQEKTALLYHDGQWHKPRGTTPQRTSSNLQSAGCQTAWTSPRALRMSSSA